MENIPKHLAIIMDGNGRWAKKQGKLRAFGHEKGVKSVRDAIEFAAENRISYLTLYTFSTENWNRPKLEVEALMLLLFKSLQTEIKELHRNNIRFNVIGDLGTFSTSIQKEIQKAKELTANNTGMTLTLALGYGSQQELTQAVKEIASKVKNGQIAVSEINEQLINQHLYTKDLPEVDLLIRTGGECRISNFLLWQISYAELYFTDILWPDFSKEALKEALAVYNNRERRFGKTSEQLS